MGVPEEELSCAMDALSLAQNWQNVKIDMESVDNSAMQTYEVNEDEEYESQDNEESEESELEKSIDIEQKNKMNEFSEPLGESKQGERSFQPLLDSQSFQSRRHTVSDQGEVKKSVSLYYYYFFYSNISFFPCLTIKILKTNK